MEVYFEPRHDHENGTGERELDVYPDTITGWCLWVDKGYGKGKVSNNVQHDPGRPQKTEGKIGYPIFSQISVPVRDGEEAFAALTAVNKKKDGEIISSGPGNNWNGFTRRDGLYVYSAARVLWPVLYRWARELHYLD